MRIYEINKCALKQTMWQSAVNVATSLGLNLAPSETRSF